MPFTGGLSIRLLMMEERNEKAQRHDYAIPSRENEAEKKYF